MYETKAQVTRAIKSNLSHFCWNRVTTHEVDGFWVSTVWVPEDLRITQGAAEAITNAGGSRYDLPEFTNVTVTCSGSIIVRTLVH